MLEDSGNMLFASSWVWAKDSRWEIKARLCLVKDFIGQVHPRLEVLGARLGGMQWSTDLDLDMVTSLIEDSGLNKFLNGKSVSRDLAEAGICLVHTILHRWVSQNALSRFFKDREHHFPVSKNLPEGMVRLPPNFTAVKTPTGAVGNQGCQGIAYPHEMFDINLPKGPVGVQGFPGVKGAIGTICPPPGPQGRAPEVGQVREVSVPEEYMPCLNLPQVELPLVRYWAVVVVDVDGNDVIVEHKPDEVCRTTIRYQVPILNVVSGRIL
jgi:hypothetical protein